LFYDYSNPTATLRVTFLQNIAAGKIKKPYGKLGVRGTAAIVNTHQSLSAFFSSLHTNILNNMIKNKFKYRNVSQKDISVATWKLEDWMLLQL
jgi:hypothetical protein